MRGWDGASDMENGRKKVVVGKRKIHCQGKKGKRSGNGYGEYEGKKKGRGNG